ncbi:MAG: FtsX-like permease family protein [Ilumatobacteraceae bacterium]
MWMLTIRDLQYRRLRLVVVVVLTSIVMALLFLMTGLVNQFNREPFDATRSIGAEQWLLAAGTSGPFTSAGTLSVDLVDEVGEDARGVVVSRGTTSRQGDESGANEEVVVVGGELADLGSNMAVDALVGGRTIEDADEVVIDRSAGYDVGELIQLGPAPVEVVGLTADTTVLAGIPLVFVELGTAQDLYFKSREVVSGVLTDVEPAEVPPGAVVRSADVVAEDALGPLKDAIASVDLVRALLWLVTAVIIGAVVFLSALERQRDFAILRAMGTPKRALLLAVAAQAVLIALLAALIAMILQRVIQPVFPLQVRVPARALWQIPLGAVVAALVAGAAGLRKVASTDPAAAFAGAA